MVYSIGDVVEGEITGIQPYGAFVKIAEEQYGLIHISEISKEYIKDIHKFVKLHQKIKVKILEHDLSSGHYKLSIKALDLSLSKEKRRNARGVKIAKMELGFKTLEEHLETWIQQAKEK